MVLRTKNIEETRKPKLQIRLKQERLELKREDKMNICASCVHWIRYPFHPNLPEQNKWGDCHGLVKADGFIAIDCSRNLGMFEIETIETFGCQVWKEAK